MNTPCLVCGDQDDEDVLLLCDGCDSAYHTYCLNLDRVPPGSWYCVECADSEEIQEIIAETRPTQNPSRTVGRIRLDYRRGRSDRLYRWSGPWGHFSSQVHNVSGVDLDFSDDDPAMADFRQLMRRTGDASREMAQRVRRTINLPQRNANHNTIAEVSRERAPGQISQAPVQSAEETLAWTAFEEAQQLQETPRGRKRKAENEPEDEPGPSTEPERRLKRPRTRRVLETAGSAAGPSTAPNDSGSATNASHTPASTDAASPSEPSFLTALLKEVEVPSTSEEDGAWPYSTTVNRPSNNGSPTQFSSPGSSPSPPPYQRGRANSMTPPPGHRSRSPLPLSSRIEPMIRRPAQQPLAHRRERETEPILISTTAEIRQHHPPREGATALARSPEASPVRDTMSIESKAAINKLVKGALAPHWKAAKITSEQYADINRDVSRKLYEEIGECTTIDEHDRWERMAAHGVESALKAMKA